MLVQADGVLTRRDEDTLRDPGMPAHRDNHKKRVAVHRPRREASTETKSADTLTMDSPPPAL